jgi:tRNA A-37 threonylcarbamoyl transferase component Bud32
LKKQFALLAEKYLLKKKVAGGETSEIWLAEDTTTGNRVVVKRIPESKRSKNIENLLLFNKEVSILKQLRHENIVEIYDFGESRGGNYIAMEYVEGRSLAAFLDERGKLDVGLFLDIAIPLSETLAFIHKQNVIHGDIKPGNIIVIIKGKEIGIKLLDFGVALLKDLSSVYRSHVSGTFAYMSPEQSGVLKRPVDLHTDLYSLGVLFYRMLSGELPYMHTDIYSLIHMHIASEPRSLRTYNPHIPEILEKVIAKLLQKETSDRYANTELLVKDLKNIKRGTEGESERLEFKPGVLDQPEISKEHVSFVGRPYELRYLKSLYSQTLKGRGRIVLISGEPGVGTTRLQDELKEYAFVSGGICVSSEFEEMENPLPYHGFICCIENFIDIMEMFSKDKSLAIKDSINRCLGKLGSSFVKIMPGLAGIVTETASIKQLEGDQEKIRFENLFINLLSSLGDNLTAVVFFIDNIQWADSGTLSLLSKLAAAKNLGNILYVLACREETEEEARSVRALYKQDNIHRLRIGNFSHDETEQVVFRMLGDEDSRLKRLADII